MDSSTPFYQQLNSRLIIIFSLFSVAIILALSLFYIRDHQVSTLLEKNLPIFDDIYQQQVKFNKIERLILKIVTSEESQFLESDRKEYVQILGELKAHSTIKAHIFDRFIVTGNDLQQQAKQLSNNHSRNHLLKQNSLVQLQLVISELKSVLNDKESKQIKIFQQITKDNVADKVTASRAKAHAQLTQSISLLRKTEIAIKNVEVLFTRLNLQYSLEEFNYFSGELLSIFDLWQAQLDNNDEASEIDKPLLSVLFQLNKLLYIDRDAIAKWREDIQASQTYFQILIEQQLKLQAQSKLLKPPNNSIKRVPKFIETFVPPPLNFDIIIITIFLFLISLICLLLIGLRKQVKRHSHQYIAYVDDLLNGVNSTGDFTSAEHQKLAEFILNVLEAKQQNSELTTEESITESSSCQEMEGFQESNIEFIEKVAQLEQKIFRLQQENQQAFIKNADKLGKMLIRTMLQSQNASIGAEIVSLPVYRQLTRIFDWCRQLQISSELQNNEKDVSLLPVNLRAELLAFSQNVSVEANHQGNYVQLALEPTLMQNAKINIRLFHRTLIGLSRLCLLEQYKSTLLITAKVTDKPVNPQIVQFTFSLITKKPKAVLPEIINAVLDSNQAENSEQIIKYIHALLSVTNCTGFQANVTQQGFKLTIDMPIDFTQSGSNPVEKMVVVDFEYNRFVLLSETSLLSKSITLSIENAKGKVEHLENVEDFTKQFSVKELTSHPVCTVIVSSQRYKKSNGVITQFLESLPKKLQPKLMVLQSNFAHSFHRDGFHEHCDSFYGELFFVSQLANFIQSKRSNNLLISSEPFNAYRFGPTQVEVLLAVNNPEKYQPLSRLLHWLGMQVHTVCQSTSMIKHWQSGRYLLLLTDIDDVSPFVEMQVGKKVSRGVFTLADCQLVNPSKVAASFSKTWQLGKILNPMDIAELVTLFTPWLKAIQHTYALDYSTTKKEKEVIDRVLPDPHLRKKPSSSHSLNSDSTEGLISSDKQNNAPYAFNLNQYAQNQGSPELAVFMLDDYIDELKDLITTMPELINIKNFKTALQNNSAIEKITLILAADDLHQTSKELAQSLNNKAIRDANAKVKILIQEYQSLVEFAQTI